MEALDICRLLLQRICDSITISNTSPYQRMALLIHAGVSNLRNSFYPNSTCILTLFLIVLQLCYLGNR